MRGAFVVLIGPDGVGKTTLACRLIEDHGPPTMYIHFRPSLWSRPPSTPGPPEAPPPKRIDPGPHPLGWLRLARSVWLFWLGYLRWVRPAVKRGALVVGDRWMYGYVGQPQALGFAGPAWLARLGARVVPSPDLLLRMTAPADLVAQRKSDLQAIEIAREDRTWDTLPIPVARLDASLEVSILAAEVATQLAAQAI